jgi:hypothetical protein
MDSRWTASLGVALLGHGLPATVVDWARAAEGAGLGSLFNMNCAVPRRVAPYTYVITGFLAMSLAMPYASQNSASVRVSGSWLLRSVRTALKALLPTSP